MPNRKRPNITRPHEKGLQKIPDVKGLMKKGQKEKVPTDKSLVTLH